MNTSYAADPKFFNDDGTINFERALAAGRRERSETATKAVRCVGQKFGNTLKAARRRFGNVIGVCLTGSLRAS